MAVKKPKVLFAAFEAAPFVKTGGLGDVGASLPVALNKMGAEVRVILPKFATIPQLLRHQMIHVTDFYMNLGWRNLYCGIEMLTLKDTIWYFVDNEYYFDRSYPYGFDDDGERIAFFAKAVVECIRYLDFQPDILHCHDWHTALSPVFLRERFQGEALYDHIRTVFTVHNLKFQGQFAGYLLGDVLGLQDCEAARNQLMQGDSVNYMRGALNYSDRLTTVSPTYAEEVCTDYYGEGLNDVFNRRRGVLSGILNGIDIQHYNPRTDPELYVRYGAKNPEKKIQNKTSLQADLGLKVDPDIPMLSIISRLTTQKGLDLVDRILPELMQENLQLVILGVGEKQYEDTFKYYASQYPDKVSANIYFDEPMSLKLYGCSDAVLVPSQFEPCGLSQMIAMRYGALPIVRETGGLKDSVTPYNEYTGEGNGFTFTNYNAHELLYTIQRAVRLYHNNRPAWDGLVKNAFDTDFSWRKSARQYLELYRGVMEDVK